MDGMLVTVAERLARKMFNLTAGYEVRSYSAKPAFIEVNFKSEVAGVKVKLPTSLVEDYMNEEGEE